APAVGRPVDGRVAAELPDARRALDQELGEVLGSARRIRAVSDGDRRAGQLHTGVEGRDLRVVPLCDLGLEDARDDRRVQLQAALDAWQVVRDRDRADQDGEVEHRLALEQWQIGGGDRRVRARELDDVRGQVGAALARAAAAVVDRDAGLDRLEALDRLLLVDELQRRSASVERARKTRAAASAAAAAR